MTQPSPEQARAVLASADARVIDNFLKEAEDLFARIEKAAEAADTRAAAETLSGAKMNQQAVVLVLKKHGAQ
jgi:hypothetical protein